MKKIFSILAFALLTMSANAQVFCDAEGNEIANGSTIVMPFDEDEEQCPLVNFGIKNTTDEVKTITVNVKNVSAPFGDFMCCVGTSCTIIKAGNNQNYTFSKVGAGKHVVWTNTEWAPYNDEGELQYGTCVAEFTMDNQKVTVKFEYSESAAIKELNVAHPENSSIYNLSGQQIHSAQKGINIINGKKYIVK